MLQYLKIKTDCTEPLILSDVYVALRLHALDTRDRGYCSDGYASLLPLSFVHFGVSADHQSVQIDWSISAELFSGRMEVQRSRWGRFFSPIATLDASDLSGISNYSYPDGQPIVGNNYYRLKIFEADGTATFSQIEAVEMRTADPVAVHPNPVQAVILLPGASWMRNCQWWCGICRLASTISIYTHGVSALNFRARSSSDRRTFRHAGNAFVEMKKTMLILFAMTMALSSIAQEQEIKDLLDRQAAAWNEGDIETFMQTYWKHDDLQFLGKTGPTFSWQGTLDNYYRRYPDRASMGHLTFEIVEWNRRSRKVYTLIGKYMLDRDPLEDLEGYFLLVLQKIKGEWLIVADSTH